MHIKTYHADSMQKALKLVRKDLGSEAIIVSTKTRDTKKRRKGAGTSGGVEVIAAIDYDLDSSGRKGKDFSGLVKREMNQVNSLGADWESRGKAIQYGLEPAGLTESASLQDELRELKWLTRFLVKKVEPLNQQHLPEQLFDLSCRMLKQ